MFPAPLLLAPRGRPRLIAMIASWGSSRVTLLMLLLGLVLRILGAYSDITQLYFRDALWRHPLPYVDYPLEYPVLVGGLVWLAGSFRHVVPYFCVTAALLIGAGLLTVQLGAQFAGANLWVFALAPALPLYVVLNWDMLGVALTVATLLALRRDRDGLAGLLLAMAVWTKFFPLVILPLAVWDRLLRRRPRDAGRLVGVFSLVSVAVNAPVALVHGPDGWALRAGWLHFFRFNRDRPLELNVWNLLARWGPTTAQINAASALLLVLGLVVLALLLAVVRRRDGARAGDLLLPATLAALGWWFFVNKVYSPQYSLWLIALLALAGVPARLGAAFAGIDVGYYVASFIALRLGLQGRPATGWWLDLVLLPAMVLREAAILVMILWGVRRLYDGAANGGNPARRGHTAAGAALPVYWGSVPTPPSASIPGSREAVAAVTGRRGASADWSAHRARVPRRGHRCRGGGYPPR
jgi:hypothetical protein